MTSLPRRLSEPRAPVCVFRDAWLGILAAAACALAPSGSIGAEVPVTTPPAARAAEMLDGRTFRVEAFEKGKKIFDDRLVFKDGAFVSEGCRNFGFGESPYYVRVDGDQIQFLAETMSPTHGTMIWRGTVKGNRFDGTFRWTKERWYWTVRRHFTVKGDRDK